MGASRYAVAEINAQEVQLKVYEISSRSGIRTVDAVRRSVPIGRDTYGKGKISADVLDQICDVLKGFETILKEYKVSQIKAVATSAVREAKNCAMVLDQIRVRTGFDIAVLSNSEQRFIRLKGAASQSNAYQMLEKGSLLVDMGAGSLQVSIFEKTVLMTTQNIALGTGHIREMFSETLGDIVSVERMLQELIDNDIDTFEKMFLKEREIKNIIIVGEGQVSYIRRSMERQYGTQTVTAQQFGSFYQSVIGKSAVEISRMLEIPNEYAASVTPTVLVYRALIDASGADTICMLRSDLCDGIVLDFAERKKLIKPKHDFNEDILAASRYICKRYMGNRSHARALEGMVLKLFDTLHRYHGLGPRERLLLQLAAILHDCGKFISMSAPGDSSYHIIMSTEILGLSHTEREIVANIARYNTLEMPSYDEFEGKLSQEEYLIVMKLAAILRVGNALDRSHKQKFENMKLVLRDSTLTITTDYQEDIMLENSILESRTKFFEEVYGIRLQLKQKKIK